MPGQHDDRRLEAALAQAANHFAPVGVGQADIHQHEVGRFGFRRMRAFRPGLGSGRLELFMQGELLHQRLAQIVVIVHDQDLASGGHTSNPLRLLK